MTFLYLQAPEVRDGISRAVDGEFLGNHHLHISVASIQGADTGAF